MNYSKKILFYILLFSFLSVNAQKEITTSFNDHIAFDVSTGVSLIKSKELSIGFHSVQAKILYCKKNINFSIGYNLQQIPRNNKVAFYHHRLIIGLDHFVINKSRLRFGYNINTSIMSLSNTLELGLLGLYRLSERYSLIVNPAIGVNYEYSYYNGSDKYSSSILSLNVGVRFNPNFKRKEKNETKISSRAYNWGFKAGFSELTLVKSESYYIDKENQYKNSFSFRRRGLTTASFLIKSKNHNIHSINFGGRNYNDPNDLNFGDNINIIDWVFSYKYDYALIKNHFNKTNSFFTPYLGLQMYWNNKDFTITKEYDTSCYQRTINVDNKSNLASLQLSPSIKYFNQNIYIDLSLNINIVAYTEGEFFYKEGNYGYCLQNEDPSIIDEKYTKFLTPTNLIEDNLLFNSIDLTIGFLF